MNMADAGMVKPLPNLRKRLLAHHIGVAGIPVVHQSPIRDSFEELDNFRSRARVAVVFVLNEERYVVLLGDIHRPFQLLHNTIENRRWLRYTSEGKNTDSLRTKCVCCICRPFQIILLPSEILLCRIDVGWDLSYRDGTRECNLEDRGVENRQLNSRIV